MLIRRLSVLAACAALISTVHAAEPINIGSRLEPLVDNYLIEATRGVTHMLHEPAPRELAIVHDRPWEGNTCGYHTVFQDGNLYRMYYRGAHYDYKTKKEAHPQVTCYAESDDGIHWRKPDLELIDFRGSRQNNIILQGPGAHDFAPFKDANPTCRPEQRYKALGVNSAGKRGLLAFQSPDGVHWSLMQAEAVITKGAFDSQNLAFWDGVRGRYVEFHRGFRNKVRDIMTSTSTDFVHWSEPVWLEQPGAAKEDLYTNQILPYDRAPHLFFGFPMRFMPTRQLVPDVGIGLSDGVFMTSRDGLHFHRWGEAFIRPGLQIERWVNRNNMTAWGLVRTKPLDPDVAGELSLYSTENYYQGESCRLRRFTLRIDGFASLSAPYQPGCALTKLLQFSGNRLTINAATAAAGWIKVEIRDAKNEPIPGYRLADCPEIIGDQIERTVAWKGGSDLSALVGKPVRLLFAMKEADLYALQFRGSSAVPQATPPTQSPHVTRSDANAASADWHLPNLTIYTIAKPVWEKQPPAAPVDIGSRRELFLDHYLIGAMNGTTLKLHRPTYAGVVLRRDSPWEGMQTFGYVTVIRDGDRFRMYYRAYPGGASADGSPIETTCYAESNDGVHWVKPKLGLFEVVGSRQNNVILAQMPPFTHNFAPVLDTRPGVPAAERFKALGGISTSGLAAFASSDGIHWTKMQEEAVLKVPGWAFDSQNVGFWMPSEQCYACYFRLAPEGVRAIARATSPDFLHWSAPTQMTYGGMGTMGTKPPENLYTNQTQPYFRAPQICIATPARFMPGRRVITDAQLKELHQEADPKEGIENDCSDAVLMSTRGGDRYERTFMEGWIRPGIGMRNWVTRSNYPACGIVPTSPSELSLYVCRHNAQMSVHMARYTLRPDGFVSVAADGRGGDMLTRPLEFAGKRLEINFSTSAAGSIRVEIQDAAGKPIPGFALADCPEIYGDRLDQAVAWKHGSDVSKLAGQPIRLRFVMKDADLYAIQFVATPKKNQR